MSPEAEAAILHLRVHRCQACWRGPSHLCEERAARTLCMPSMSHHKEVSQHEHRDALDEQVDEEDEPMITVLLVNDEAIVREGLRMRLALEQDITIAGEASTGAEALEQVQRLQPDIVLMDLALPDMDGIAAIAALRAAHAAGAVVILSLQDDAT